MKSLCGAGSLWRGHAGAHIGSPLLVAPTARWLALARVTTRAYSSPARSIGLRPIRPRHSAHKTARIYVLIKHKSPCIFVKTR